MQGKRGEFFDVFLRCFFCFLFLIANQLFSEWLTNLRSDRNGTKNFHFFTLFLRLMISLVAWTQQSFADVSFKAIWFSPTWRLDRKQDYYFSSRYPLLSINIHYILTVTDNHETSHVALLMHACSINSNIIDTTIFLPVVSGRDTLFPVCHTFPAKTVPASKTKVRIK